MADAQRGRGTLGTIRNAALLLRLLSEGPPYQQLSDLGERSGLSVATVHRLLRSLAEAGMVEQDPETARYSLGPELARLSTRYLARLPVLRALTPYLAGIRDVTKSTVLVSLLVRDAVVSVDLLDAGEDDEGVFRDAHQVRPAIETAAGRVLLARADPAVWQEALECADGDARFTEEHRAAWAAEPYLVVPDAGSFDRVEIAVPVLDSENRARVGLSALCSLERVGAGALAERVAPQLLRAANAARRTVNHE